MTLRGKAQVICTAIALLSAPVLASAQSSTARITVNAIAPQPLADALDAFMQATGLQLVYPAHLTNGIRTRGVTGGVGVEEALRQLLEGTGLTYTYVNDRTFTIIPDPNAPQTRPGGSATPEIPRIAEQTVETDVLPPSVPESSPQHIEGEVGRVIITGSHLSDARPVGSKTVTLERREIDRSGLSTVQDFIRTLPQNFNGGPSEDTRNGTESAFNFSRGTGVNLRGLGAGSTLVLLNGRRMAPGGGDGRFTDISTIPLTAVDRIELLPYGASAIYGADAVGGVVNIILRDGYEGIETHIRHGAVTSGPTAESQIGQTFGKSWITGNALLSFEYYERDGLPASARAQSAVSDLTPFGGDNFDIPAGNPGTIIDANGTWAIPRGQNGQSLRPEDFVPGTANLHNRNEGRDLLANQERKSVLGTMRHEFSDRWEIFADALYSERDSLSRTPMPIQPLVVPSSNPFHVNPSGTDDPVTVLYGFGADFGPEVDTAHVTTMNVSPGVTFRASEDWKLTAYTNVSRSSESYHGGPYIDEVALAEALADSNPETAFNPFADGSYTNPETLASIVTDVRGRRKFGLESFTLIAEGTVARWGDREITLAAGTEVQRQSVDSFLRRGSTTEFDRHFDRDIWSGFAEVLIPLVDPAQRLPGLERLDLSIATRYEHFSDFGGAQTPRVGLSWSPFSKLAVRGSWSRSVKAPNLVDRDESNNLLQIDTQPDPLAPESGQLSNVLLWFGDGNRDLQKETATTWTLGAEFRDTDLGLSLNLTYFDINLRDRAARPDYHSLLLQDPLLANLVTRNPSPELRAEACSRGTYVGVAEDCLNSEVAALVDLRVQNLAVMQLNGIDFSGAYKLPTDFGAFTFGINGTYMFNFAQARFEGQPLDDLIDTQNNPIDLRVRSSLSYTRGGFDLTSVINYYDGYKDTLSQPNRSVGSWTTIDLQASYAFPASGLTVAVNAQNAFDRKPPFLNNPAGVGYDEENADLLGRFLSLQLRKEW